MRARKRSLLVLLFGVFGLVLATGAVAWACTSDSWITADPTSGIPGATVQVDGGSFVNGQVHLYWDSTTSSSHLKSVDTDQVSQGENSPGDSGFSTTVTIPEGAQPGHHAIVARSDPDGEGKRYNASAPFEVVAGNESPSQPSEGGSDDTSGDSSNTSGESTPETSGESTPETSGETSANTTQGTSGTTSQAASGRTSQESSGEAASGPNTIPPAQSEPSQDAAETDDTGTSPDGAAQAPAPDPDPGAGEPAQDRQTAAEATSPPAPSEPAPSAPQAPAPADEAGNAPTSAAAPTPDASSASGEPPTADDSASASQGEGSQGTPAEEPSAADSDQAGFSVPEAMRVGPDDGAAQAPSRSSAGGDLWSGLESGETPSLTPGSAVEEESADELMSGALTAGVALLALGSMLLLGAFGATAVRRRRQPATVATRSREHQR